MPLNALQKKVFICLGRHLDTTLINMRETLEISKPRSWPSTEDGQLKVKAIKARNHANFLDTEKVTLFLILRIDSLKFPFIFQKELKILSSIIGNLLRDESVQNILHLFIKQGTDLCCSSFSTMQNHTSPESQFPYLTCSNVTRRVIVVPR